MNVLKKSLLASAVALASATAVAEVSMTIGTVSDYVYRGSSLGNAGAYTSIDYGAGGFYAGVWSADVGEGLEVDGYFGYGADVGDLSVSVGFTGYYYTGDFDDTYEEINTNFGYGPVSLEYSAGTWDGDDSDYSFTALSADLGAGFAATYGSFGQDFEGAYFQADYGFSVAELDLGVSLIFPDDDIGGGEAIVFSVGKSF